MKINAVEKKEKSTVLVTIQFDAKEFEDALNEVYKKNRHSIAISGFRKGKAPRKIVEHMYGEEIFHEDAANELCQKAFQKVIDEEKLNIVGKPQIGKFSADENKELTVEITVGVYPEVKLGQYKELSAVRAEKLASDGDADAEISALQHRNARVAAVEREARNEDTVIIDFIGYLDGVPFEGGTGEQQSLKLGSNTFVPGFEEQLIGAKAGDEVNVNITFPEEYTDELKGKDVVFVVQVQEVRETILPELDDEFAKDVSEYDTLEELRNSIKEHMNKTWADEAEKDYQQDLLGQATDNMETEIPEAMVIEQAEQLSQEFYYSVTSQGMQPDEYLAMMGLDKVTFMQANMRNAHKRVAARLLLTAIAEQEGFEASEEEINAKYAEMTEMYQMDEERIRQVIGVDDIIKDIKMDKASSLIFSTATVKEPEPEEATEDTPAQEEAAAERPAAKKVRKAKTENTKTEKAKAEKTADESKPKAKVTAAKTADTKKTQEE